MPLSPGTPVPPVTATTQDGDRITVTFQDPTVLFFFPDVDDPESATEASGFQAQLDAYREAGVAVYGVSTASVEAHAAVADRVDLGFDLLSDPDANVTEAFEVERGADGRPTRTTFVCAGGQVCGLYEGVRPEGHAKNVLLDVHDVGLVPRE